MILMNFPTMIIPVWPIQIHLRKTSVVPLRGHVMNRIMLTWVVFVMMIGSDVVNDINALTKKPLINALEYLLNTIHRYIFY